MLTINCKYCLIETNKNGYPEIICFNDLDKVCVEVYKSLIYDCTIDILTEKTLIIKGKEDETHWTDFKYVSDMKHIPQKQYIKYDKGITICGITMFDSPCYVKGWYRTEAFKKVSYVLNNFNLKTID